MSSSDNTPAIQAELIRAVKAAAAAIIEDPALANLHEGHDLTQTEVAIVASALLKAADVEIFELAMWQTWGSPNGRREPDADSTTTYRAAGA
jgi:hypothetical protein